MTTPALGSVVNLTLPAGHLAEGEAATVAALVGAVRTVDGVTHCDLLALRPFRPVDSWYQNVPEGTGEETWAAPATAQAPAAA